MPKGTMTEQYKVGDQIEFLTSHVEKKFSVTQDKKGRTIRKFDREIKTPSWLVGTIVKLHKSGTFGIAEIRPLNPYMNSKGELTSKKISRKLQCVRRVVNAA